jgi:hypothetical protein
MITLALQSSLSSRIDRSRAFSRPWSHSTRLLAYRSVRCQALATLLQHHRVHRRLIGGDLRRRHEGPPDHLLEEAAGRLGVPPCRDQHIDDLPELVDRTLVQPRVSSLHVCLGLERPALAYPARCSCC